MLSDIFFELMDCSPLWPVKGTIYNSNSIQWNFEWRLSQNTRTTSMEGCIWIHTKHGDNAITKYELFSCHALDMELQLLLQINVYADKFCIIDDKLEIMFILAGCCSYEEAYCCAAIYCFSIQRNNHCY